jgi:tRNA threonylcarbamoyl adenosine modification protein (Sua5/YciO/YrdC/YwlC family)
MIARTTLPLTSLIVNNNNNDNNRRRISSSNSSKRGRRRNNYPLKLFAKQRNNINIKTTTTTDRAELFEVSRTDPNMRTLEECANLIRKGGVGIIPTDTKYSFVADLNNKDAIQNLYFIKGIDSNKPLSILCRGFQDIDKYTLGFPPATEAGMQDPFKLARKCLPGPYTFILPASKSLPKVCLVDTSSAGHTRLSKCQQRKTIGCRVPDCEVTLALLELLDAPLMMMYNLLSCETSIRGALLSSTPA